MEHTKLDHLFQKRLENLEASPNNKVWNTIERKLKKKKRSVISFWRFSGSIAAFLILGLLFYPFNNDKNSNNNIKSDEIITTIQKTQPILEDKLDSIIIRKKIKNNLIITEKVKSFNNQTLNANLITSQKKPVKPKNKLNSLLLSYHPIDKNLIHNIENSNFLIINKKDKLGSKKIVLNTFIKEGIPEKPKTSDFKNWSISPVFALLKSNSFTNTSPINESLKNSTNGENSYSYGVQLTYSINKKWSIQSGIHFQEMSYSNNHIGIYNSSTTGVSTTQFTNGESFSFDSNSTENLSLSSDLQTSVISTNGNLIQSYGYIEIPVEIKYNLSKDSKFRPHLIAGVSSLFLNKNEVILLSENLSKTLEVTNLNSINFSGNFGLDFGYNFNDKWSLNLNPMLKIQLNTFNSNANGFAPFNLGVYSGIRYNF